MHRSWTLPCLLLLLPLFVYSNTIFAEFGLRDDYSILREAREEPGKVLQGCGAQARPLYGVLLEQSFRRLNGIPDLCYGRMAAALLLGATIVTAALIFCHLLRWPVLLSTITAGLLGMLPSAQVLVSWSICWPFTLATLLAAAAFATARRGWSAWPSGRSWPWLIAAVVMLIAATLIYPPQALLFLVFVAAAIPSHRESPIGTRLIIIARDVALLGASLGIGFLIAQLLFFTGAFPVSPRIVFERHWLDKLVWIVHGPLKQALALFALDDYYGRADSIQWASVTVVVVALIAAGVTEFRRHGWRVGVLWAIALVVLSVNALGITLLAAERWAPYRTLYSLSGVLLVFVVIGFYALFERARPRWRPVLPAVLVAALVLTSITARNHAWSLIAVPQMEELRLVRVGSAQIDPALSQQVFVICPTEVDATSEIIFDDEFGSLSTNSDWTPGEMIGQVMHQRFPALTRASVHPLISTGWFLPNDKKWDVVINLKHMVGRAAPAVTVARKPIVAPPAAAVQSRLH